jgi:hypothetical protein
MTQMQKLARSMNSMVPLSAYLNNPPDVSAMLQQNVSSPTIKRVKSYEVQVHIQKIKHTLQLPIDPLLVTFDSYENVNSFNIDYRMSAANIPHEVTGLLHVIIQKNDKG